MIKYILLVNKQGQTRFSRYYIKKSLDEKVNLEAEVTRKCLSRSENQSSFVDYTDHKVIYRRYASLFFIVGVDHNENELAILEFIHNIVETFDRIFENIMYHLETAHFILDEMVVNGHIVETNKPNVLEMSRLYSEGGSD